MLTDRERTLLHIICAIGALLIVLGLMGLVLLGK